MLRWPSSWIKSLIRPDAWPHKATRLDPLQLTCVDAGVLRGLVTDPSIPGESPGETHHPEDHEDPSPVHHGEHAGDKDRREASGQVRPHEEDALRGSSFRGGKPSRERARGIGPGSCFAGAEQEADNQ